MTLFPRSILIFLSFNALACGKSDDYGIDVAVKDSADAPVEGASVEWRDAEATYFEEAGETNGQGLFKYVAPGNGCAFGYRQKEVQPGVLLVFKDGYRSLEVAYDRHEPAHLVVVLVPL